MTSVNKERSAAQANVRERLWNSSDLQESTRVGPVTNSFSLPGTAKLLVGERVGMMPDGRAVKTLGRVDLLTPRVISIIDKSDFSSMKEFSQGCERRGL